MNEVVLLGRDVSTLRKIVASKGYYTQVFNNFIELKKYLNSHAPQLILAYCDWPIVQILNSISDHKLLLIGKKKQEKEIAKALALGVTDYLIEPIDATQVLRKIKKHLVLSPISKKLNEKVIVTVNVELNAMFEKGFGVLSLVKFKKNSPFLLESAFGTHAVRPKQEAELRADGRFFQFLERVGVTEEHETDLNQRVREWGRKG